MITVEQNMAEKTFGEIRRGNGPVRNSGQVHPTTWERPWTEYAFHRLIYVTPVKDNHEIGKYIVTLQEWKTCLATVFADVILDSIDVSVTDNQKKYIHCALLKGK